MINKKLKKVSSISFDIPLLAFAKERSKKMGVSLARYINWLIAKEVQNYLDGKEEVKNER